MCPCTHTTSDFFIFFFKGEHLPAKRNPWVLVVWIAVNSILFMWLFASFKEEKLPLYARCNVIECARVGSSLLTSHRLEKSVGFPAKLSNPSLSFYFPVCPS